MNYKYKLIGIILLSIISVFMLAAAFGYYYYIPRNVDFDKYKTQIRDVLKRRVLYPSEFGEFGIKLTWNFRARVTTEKVTIKKLNGDKFVELGPSFLEVPILPLLNNRVVIKKININTLECNVTRFENGEFDIAGIFAMVEKPKYKVTLNDADIFVNGYKVNFNDERLEKPRNYLFAGKKIKIDDYCPNKYLKLNAEGKTFLDNSHRVDFDLNFSTALPFLESRKFHIGGKLKNLEIETLNPYLDGKLTLQGKGDVNFDVEVYKKFFGKNKFFVDAVLQDLKVETAAQGLISEHPGELKVITRGYYNENLTNLDNLVIKSEDIDVRASGDVSKNDVNLKMNFENSEVQPLVKLFPKIFKIKKEPVKKALKHKVQANVSGRLKVKGNRKTPEMYGKIYYRNLCLPQSNPDAPLGYGNIDFAGHYLILENKLFVDKNSFVTVTGKVSPFKHKTVYLDVITGEMDMDRANRILAVVHDFFKFKLGPVEKMGFKGTGRVNLNINGDFVESKLNGYVETNGLEVSYEGFSKPAKNVSGKVLFVDKRVYYDQVRGYSEGMEVRPTGYSTLKGYSNVELHLPELELTRGLDFVNTSPLLKEAKTALKDVLVAQGKADARIQLVGTEENLDTSGVFYFKDGFVRYRGFGVPFEKINGVLKYNNEDVYFEGLTGFASGNKAAVTGYIKGDMSSDLKIVSDSIDLAAAKIFVSKSPILEKARVVVDDFTDVSGKSAVEIHLKGNIEGEPFENMVLTGMDCYFNHKMTNVPVHLDKGMLKITADAVNAVNVEGDTLGMRFFANGWMRNLKNYTLKKERLVPDFALKVKKFDFSNFLTFINAPLTPPEVKKVFADFGEFHGTGSVDVVAKGEDLELNIVPVNVSAVYQPYEAFVLIKGGTAKISNRALGFSSLKGVISESDFEIDGFIDKNSMDVTTNFFVNSNDIAKFRYYSDIPVVASGIIPFTLNLKGKPDDWGLTGRMLLEKGTYVSYFTDIGLPRDRVRYLNLQATGTKNRVNIERLGLDIENDNLVSVYGVIDNIKSSKPQFKDFIIKTNSENPIKTNIFNPSIGQVLDNGCQNFFTSGVFELDLKFNGYVDSPKVEGRALFQDIRIPDYQTYVKLVSMDFSKNQTKIDIDNLAIGQSVMHIDALMDNKLETPVIIDDLQINSPMLNIDELSGILPGKTQKSPNILPSAVITNGNLNAGAVIVKNLAASNVKAEFNFTRDWQFSAPKISLIASNGVGQGSVLYNLKTSELSSSFKIRGMKANDIATALLMLPNEVYGTLDGNFKFSTKGENQQELIANSSGYAEFTVTKGYFVRLGSLEHLLRAANVLHSGVGGFNFNNIIDLISPQKTGYFEKLQGNVHAMNGVLYTEDITSSGKNLSLFISGRLDMLTNNADIQVLGRMSKKISGMLGPIGSVSINQFIDYIPGLGFLPNTADRKGIIDLIPGLSKIPGLELNDDKYRQFAVQINGDLYNQDSVRSFRWIE